MATSFVSGSGGLQPFDKAAVEGANRAFTEQSLAALTPATHDAMFSPVFATNAQARQQYIDKQNAKLRRSDFPAYVRAIARTIQFVLRASCEQRRLAELRCPTLLLWGSRIRSCRPRSRRKLRRESWARR